MNMAEKKLGFIGVGAMGGPIAGRLLDAGYALTICDVSDAAANALVAKGAIRMQTPKEVADKEETVIVSLPTPDVVHHVALGENGLARGSAIKDYVDLSTTGSVMAIKVAEGLEANGINVLDCPVSGGVRGAEVGSLALMMSGPQDLADRMKPALENIGRNLFFIGETRGAGQTMKLTNNFLSAIANVATGEAVTLGVKAGLDPAVMLDVLNASSGRNSATEDKFPKSVLTGTYDKSMAQRLLLKDVRLCTEEAEALGVPMWMGAAVRQFLTFAVGQGTGEEPSIALVKYYEEWAGVKIAKDS
jgi:3-hydroxyisobutyrate dehydrogenase-like beta-hydroxyacid dehydrogenase